MEKPITKAQLQMIHTLLNKQGLTHLKAELVYSFSDGRTQSSRELTLIEAKRFIQYLKDQDASSDIIKRIYHLGYLSGIIYGETPEDKAMNTAKLNMFCKERGTVKKALHQQSVKELKRTVKQFESIAHKKNEQKCLKEYIQIAEEATRKLIQVENYEGAEHNRQCIENVKKEPYLAVKYLEKERKASTTN